MKTYWHIGILVIVLLPMTACAKVANIIPDASLQAATRQLPTDPYDLISQESLLATVEALTSIQPYSGWRNSASQGEQEALDFMQQKVGKLEYLSSLGLEFERQDFHVFLGTELWETHLLLKIGEQEVEVPADGLRGPRDDIGQALNFDSDGSLNDSARNPMLTEGSTVVVLTTDEIMNKSEMAIQDKVVLLNYATIDRSVLGIENAQSLAKELIQKHPAGLVLITSFSNTPHESHGSFVGDLSVLNNLDIPLPPTLYARLEDLAPAGIEHFENLAKIEKARLIWDADVFSPGSSANLIARIPGEDPSQAIILGAHIDSPNAPGAMDDGSGAAILFEVARVLDQAQVQPAVDLYLVWFGSEELGLYGSSHFAATHQDLMDRALAMLQIDCLTRPLDGIEAYLNLVTWSYGRFGDSRLLWPEFIEQSLAPQEIDVLPVNYYGIESDNSSLAGYRVPNANLIYMNHPAMESLGSIHYAGHIHDPYDTLELAREMSDVLEEMARVALTAALETGRASPDLQVPPAPDHRALFIASHTESIHIGPATFIDMSMAMAMEGVDIDLLAYGQPIRSADLQDVDAVIVLPVHDYPTSDGDLCLYDEAWLDDEVETLVTYVSEGGFLVLTNSANRLKYGNMVLDLNEDWNDANTLASRFGVTYQEGALVGSQAQVEGEHPLLDDAAVLALAQDNGIPFTFSTGDILARIGEEPAMVLTDQGDQGGQVLVLADVGMLGAEWSGPTNLPFWQNLARYIRTR